MRRNFVVILFLVLYIYFAQSVMKQLVEKEQQLTEKVKQKTLGMAMAQKQQPFSIDVLAQMPTSLCKPKTDGVEKRVGRAGFYKTLVSAVALDLDVSSHKSALVLACTSGVGKTFATLTARQGFQQQQMENGGKKRYEPVVAYIGFSSVAPLSYAEMAFLRGNSGWTEIMTIVFSRLFCWLNAYQQLQSPADLDIPPQTCRCSSNYPP